MNNCTNIEIDMPEKMLPLADIGLEDVSQVGIRAARFGALAQVGVPIPKAVAVPKNALIQLYDHDVLDMSLALDLLTDGHLLLLRASPENLDWGGPQAIKYIGANDAYLEQESQEHGRAMACETYRKAVQNYGVAVHAMDPDDFENILIVVRQNYAKDNLPDAFYEELLAKYLSFFEEETGVPFPQDPAEQVRGALLSMMKSWNSPTTKMVRVARGAPEDASLALIIQRMKGMKGQGLNGLGYVQFTHPLKGFSTILGEFRDQNFDLSQAVYKSVSDDIPVGKSVKRNDALENTHPEIVSRLKHNSDLVRKTLAEEMTLNFALQNGEIWILDAKHAKRSARAAIQIAVDLAKDGVISKKDAILRIDPRQVNEQLHPQIDENAARNIIATGIGASPGAVSGQLVFTTRSAEQLAAREVSTILVRVETGPEDIRGMHVAKGIVTQRGGATSHAAVIARGLGLPCVVGVGDIKIDYVKRQMSTADRQFNEGDVITIDGSTGQLLMGALNLIPPKFDGSFAQLMKWADEYRTIGVRANADTPQDAQIAKNFGVDGIGLCRTEHLFFSADRINVMRQMIMSNDSETRRETLAHLLPMQRTDFKALFSKMVGLPVNIRLLDPPLHEFLPKSRDDIQTLAVEMGISTEALQARVDELAEFNPMLGMRGVRLGIVVPEIYQMQVRAMFEAAIEATKDSDRSVDLEIMIPLVSCNREVEVVKAQIETVAREVETETGQKIPYKLGVMVETPRAALRAEDLAQTADFLSFGTNDLTQMTYGLSRDDAGRFMRQYVNQSVFPEDPFISLDLEGVGELLLIAATRARKENPDMQLGLCGEHGGDPASVRFCKLAGFDYVSCSPYRTPIARLAAAQASLLD